MTRDLPAGFSSALDDAVLRPILLFEGEFTSGTVRLWTGYGELAWQGEAWTGAGKLIGIGEINETEDIVAQGTSISLSGVPQDLVGTAIAEARQGAPGRVWLGLLGENGEVIADPHLVFAGRLDVPQIGDDGESAVITITYENRLIDLRRPRSWRYTHESQQALYPGDRGFEYVAAIQEMEIVWGRK